ITRQDVENLKLVRARLVAAHLRCVLIFSKTADKFSENELALFKELAVAEVPCILLLNRELEPYEPYETYGEGELLTKHATSLEQMAWNSQHYYLLNSKLAVSVKPPAKV